MKIGKYFFRFSYCCSAFKLFTNTFIPYYSCDSCKEKNRPKCYHWSVGDETSIASFQQQLEEQLDLYLSNCGATFNEVQEKTKIIYDPCKVTRQSNQWNIDYIPDGKTDDEKIMATWCFSNPLTTELMLRRQPLYGSLEDRRFRLKKYLVVEQMLKIISQAILRGAEGKAALMLIMQAIPCIMHLENRVGEKLITVLLSMGAERFQKQRGSRSLTRFVTNIQHIVNTRILGTEARPKQWRVPLNEKGDSVNKVSLSNKKTRLFIDNISCLVDYIFSAPEDAELREVW